MFLQYIKSVLFINAFLSEKRPGHGTTGLPCPTMYNMEVFEEELIAGTVVPVKTLRNFHGPRLSFIFLEDFL